MRHNEENQVMLPVVHGSHQTLNDSAGIIGIIFFRSRPPAINSFSRVARSHISASAGFGWYSAAESAICYPDLSREPLCRQRNLLLTYSCQLRDIVQTRPPDLFAASNRWLNWLVRAQLLYSVLLILLYQLAQVWLGKDKTLMNHLHQADGFTIKPRDSRRCQTASTRANNSPFR